MDVTGERVHSCTSSMVSISCPYAAFTRDQSGCVRFGAIVMRLRLARGWTIVEQGRNIPSLTTVLELIEVLGADIAEVMRELMTARNSPPAAPTV